MVNDEQEKIRIHLLDACSMDTFDFLHNRFMEFLPEKEVLEFTTDYINWLKKVVDIDKPDLVAATALSKFMEIKWDEPKYLCYINYYGKPDFMPMINESDVSWALMGIVTGIHKSIDNFETLKMQLENGEELDELYRHQQDNVSFVEINKADIEFSKAQLFKDLVESYNEAMDLVSDKQLYLETEIKEFQRLFESGQSVIGWDYLADRMMLPTEDIEDIYQCRSAFIQGRQEFSHFSFDRNQRVNYAILLGVREYLSFIKDDNGQQTAGVGDVGVDSNHEQQDIHNKLVLKPAGDNNQNMTLNITKAYDILLKEKIIDGDRKSFQSIFLPGIPLRRKVKWLTDRKELKYLICKLSGKDFSEKTSDASGYIITIKGTGGTVFWDNTKIFEKAANSFLDKDGNRIPEGGVQKNNVVTPLSPARRKVLDQVVDLFTAI